MKKKVLSSLLGIALATSIFGSFVSYAQDYTFDPNYYARRYPDVVQALGNDPVVLEKHYLTHGINEGRYVCQAEETYYFENGLKKETSITNTTVENPTEIKEAPKLTTVYTPIEITPMYKTYVDVDKTNQVVTYFEDGVMKFQGPCVTGNERTKHGTPTGTFSITQHMTNKYLIGPTWKSYVSYWMRFSFDGCGLHDASWRSAFGGEIYKTNGSHGCVNLEKDFAKQLFEVTKVGTTVYVHD